MKKMSSVRAQGWAIAFARITLGSSFLSGVADRFGFWPARYEGYGDFSGFISYTAKVNAFMPAWTVPYLAWAATFAEFALGVALVVGYGLRWVSLATGVLLVLFGVAMALSFGLKSPLDYSVFSAAAAASLLAVLVAPGRAEPVETQPTTPSRPG